MVRTLMMANQNSASVVETRQRRSSECEGRIGRLTSVHLGSSEVDCDGDDEAHGDPDRDVDRRVPVADEDGGSVELSGENESPGVGVLPSHFWTTTSQ